MDRQTVQRLTTSKDSQKARGLLERLRSEALHLPQLLASARNYIYRYYIYMYVIYIYVIESTSFYI